MRPCTVSGNVGATPELRYTPNGVPVCNFSLALFGGKTEAGDNITTWVRITCWKDLAEAINKAVSKGDKIRCEGYLAPARLFEDKEGNMKASIELTAFSIKALEYTEVDLHPEDEISAREPAESMEK